MRSPKGMIHLPTQLVFTASGRLFSYPEYSPTTV
jgi:hypothetical protein